jgi:hypothetical protein
MSNRGKGILGRWDATSEEIRQAIGEAIYLAMRKHKEAGVPAVTWRDGKVVLIPPQDIVIPDDDAPESDPTETKKASDSD